MGDHVTNCDPTTRGGGSTSDLRGEADESGGDGIPGERAGDQNLPSVVGLVPMKQELRVEHVGLLAINIRYGSGSGRGNPFDSAVIGHSDRDYDLDLNLVDDVTLGDVGVIVIAGGFRSCEV